MKRMLCIFLVATMLCAGAFAETVTVAGEVVCVETKAVLSPAAGIIEDVQVRTGDAVQEGGQIASLYGHTVYAQQSGTVRLFGSVGEPIDALVDRYGAVLYIEPDRPYTVSCTTDDAYDKIENRIVHPGESVYLRSVNSRDAHTGMGIVTSVSASAYTVEVTESTWLEGGESLNVYRESDYSSLSRIGSGSVTRRDPVAYADGQTDDETQTPGERISDILVTDGSHVEIGDPLYRRVTADALSAAMCSDVDGTVASVAVSAGDAVEQGTVVATIYPDSAKRLSLTVEENDMRFFKTGSEVTIEFTSGALAKGQVERVSGVRLESSAEGEEEGDADEDICFEVYVTFEADQEVQYGMTAKVKSAETED